VILLCDSCETYFDSEEAEVIIQKDFDEEAKVFMAWLNEKGNISNDVTSNFLMVDKSGVEKVLITDNYLVSIADSADVQIHSTSIFDGEIDYIPSRIVSGDYELVLSDFDENAFTFTMNIIYPDNDFSSSLDKSGKEKSEEKKILTLENQKFEPETESSLRKLRDYVTTVGRASETGQYLNTLKIATNDAFLAKKYNRYYNFALEQADLGNRGLLQSLSKDLNFKRFLGLKWKSKLALEITKSVTANVIINGDWGTYNNEISLALSGAFAIAGCVGTLGLGCGLGAVAFAADAYNYYTTEYLPTHIVRISHPDGRVPGNNNCNCEATTYTVTFGGSKSVTIGLNEIQVITLKAGVYEITEISTGLRNDRNRTSNMNINSDNISFSLGCVCVDILGKSSKTPISSNRKGTFPLGV
jgi:hypothetical protein